MPVGIGLGWFDEGGTGMIWFLEGWSRVGANEEVKAREQGPLGGPRLRFLELILLLEGIDPILALDVGLPGLATSLLPIVHGVGHLLPVLLPEVPPAQLEVPVPPRLYQRLRRSLAPAVLPPSGATGVRWRRRVVAVPQGAGIHGSIGIRRRR